MHLVTIRHGQSTPGPFLACTCVVFKCRSWQKSAQVWKRSLFPAESVALEPSRALEAKLCRRQDALAAGTVYFARPDPLAPEPTDEQVLHLFIGQVLDGMREPRR
jgi:hypothetical protein